MGKTERRIKRAFILSKNYCYNQYYKEKEYMKTDIFEKENKYIIETDLPGIKKENIKISYENGYLTIKITKNSLSESPFLISFNITY